MACGETPSAFTETKSARRARMANLRNLRQAFVKAQKYKRDWSDYLARQSEPAKPRTTKTTRRINEASIETLLSRRSHSSGGQMLVEWHCYRLTTCCRLCRLPTNSIPGARVPSCARGRTRSRHPREEGRRRRDVGRLVRLQMGRSTGFPKTSRWSTKRACAPPCTRFPIGIRFESRSGQSPAAVAQPCSRHRRGRHPLAHGQSCLGARHRRPRGHSSRAARRCVCGHTRSCLRAWERSSSTGDSCAISHPLRHGATSSRPGGPLMRGSKSRQPPWGQPFFVGDETSPSRSPHRSSPRRLPPSGDRDPRCDRNLQRRRRWRTGGPGVGRADQAVGAALTAGRRADDRRAG